MEFSTIALLTFFLAVIVIAMYFMDYSLGAGEKAKLEPRLKRFRDFFEVLTNEKTANHVGSGAMKNLRSMLALSDLEPAILRAWSRGLRKTAGTFNAVLKDTAKMIEGVDPKGVKYYQVMCEVEFNPLPKENAPSADNGEHQKKQEPVVLGCLVRFRASDASPPTNSGAAGAEAAAGGDADDGTPAPEKRSAEELRQRALSEMIIGFNVVRPMRDQEKEQQQAEKGGGKKDPSQPPLLDIIRSVDPMEMDQFAERAVESLFDSRNSKDPMTGFFQYCVKPLQNLYDVAGILGDSGNQQQDAVAAAAAAAAESSTSTSSGLEPKKRREKLAQDIQSVKLGMGIELPRGTFAPTVTMQTAELDTTMFPKVKSIAARVLVEGKNRDCILTLHIVLDAVAPWGCSVAKFAFAFGPNKQRSVIYDQDTGTQMAGM